MLTTAIFTLLKLGRLITIQTMGSSASLTGGHVVILDHTDLESGTFLVERQLFQL